MRVGRPALLLAGLLVAVTAAAEVPRSHSFDEGAGVLAVDRAAYLGEHDLVWSTPLTEPSRGLTVGNGRVGFMVWQEDGLTAEVSNVDASPQTQLSCGRIRLSTDPGSFSTIEQRLVLHDGLARVTYDSDRSITIFGDPGSELMAIHVEDSRPGVSAVALDLSIWDTSGLANDGYHRQVANIEGWRTPVLEAETATIAISRAQADPDNWGYTLMAAVDGTGVSTEVVDARTLRLNITPAPSYTIWIACVSRQDAPGNDSRARAEALIEAAGAAGSAAVLNACTTFWHDFWERSFVQYGGFGRGALLEQLYYVNTYQIAVGAMGSRPYHFSQGVHSWDGDGSLWGSAYWHFNTRAVYASFLASNHADLMGPYFDLYLDNLAQIEADTLARYGFGGARVPETMPWNGEDDLNEGSDFTRGILSTSLEVAENLYRRYLFTGEAAWLAEVYPFMRSVAEFFESRLTWTGTQWTVEGAHSLENYWNVDNPLPDLAGIRALMPMLIEASEVLGVDEAQRPLWRSLADDLAPFSTTPHEYGALYLACDPPVPAANNQANPEIEGIWPHGLMGLGTEGYGTAVNTFDDGRLFPVNIWSPDAVAAARLGLGDRAYELMLEMVARNCRQGNGLHFDGNGSMESAGLGLAAINESLLHSHGGVIRVFPATPSSTDFVGAFTLLAEGGFLVSSEKRAGEVEYVGLRSLRGEDAAVVSPWPGATVRVRRTSDDHQVLTSSDDLLAFATEADEVYVLERLFAPLDSLFFAEIADHPVAPTNLSSGASVVVSSTYDGATPGAAAVDGDILTRWASQVDSDPEWIYLDLGSVQNVDAVVVNWVQLQHADHYRIDVSDDAAGWTTVREVEDGDGGVDIVAGLGARGRFVRLWGVHAHDNWWGSLYALHELEVYGPRTASDLGGRRVHSLDGEWQLSRGGELTPPVSYGATVPVPGLVDLADGDPGSGDWWWYRTTFTVEGPAPSTALLKLHKAKYGVRAWLNGHDLGEHWHNWTPAYFDVLDSLDLDGRNELVVRVGTVDTYPDWNLYGHDTEKPTYIPGIWDSVELILTGAPHIERVQTAFDLGGELRVVALLTNPTPAMHDGSVDFELRRADTGELVAAHSTAVSVVSGAEATVDEVFAVPGAHLWSPEDPFLYDLVTRTAGDERSDRIGLRTFTFDSSPPYLPLLNGQGYYLRGTNLAVNRFLNDPQRGTLVWNETWVRELMTRLEQMGLNSFRFHIGYAPDFWYDIADEVGLLVQDELAIWYLDDGIPPTISAATIADQVRDSIYAKCNNPSVVVWDMCNETEDEKTTQAIQMLAGVDIQGLPFDNGWSDPVNPGDPIELHPYFYYFTILFWPQWKWELSMLDESNCALDPDPQHVANRGSALTDHARILNEFGWLWLNRDSSPVVLTDLVYESLLGAGPGNNAAARRRVAATHTAAMAEFWRATGNATGGVQTFVSLSASKPGVSLTSDPFTDIEQLIWDPDWKRFVTDALAPVGLCIDRYWGLDDVEATGEDLAAGVTISNDTPEPWSGPVELKLMDRGLKTSLAMATEVLAAPPFGKSSCVLSLEAPLQAGDYSLVAEIQDREAAVRSVRDLRLADVQLCDPSSPVNGTCETAEPIPATPFTVSADSSSACDDLDHGAWGFGRHSIGRDVVYRLHLAQPAVVCVALTADGTFDPALYLVADCASQAGYLAGSDEAGCGVAEGFCRALYPLPGGQSFYLVVDAVGAHSGGSFTLDVSSFPAPPESIFADGFESGNLSAWGAR